MPFTNRHPVLTVTAAGLVLGLLAACGPDNLNNAPLTPAPVPAPTVAVPVPTKGPAMTAIRRAGIGAVVVWTLALAAWAAIAAGVEYAQHPAPAVTSDYHSPGVHVTGTVQL